MGPCSVSIGCGLAVCSMLAGSYGELTIPLSPEAIDCDGVGGAELSVAPAGFASCSWRGREAGVGCLPSLSILCAMSDGP